MKYRKVKTVMAAMLVAAMAVGCGGETEKTESDAGSDKKAEEEVKEVSEAEKVKEIIAKVNEAYAKEKVAGGESTTVTSYDDDSKVDVKNTWVLNREKQIYQNTSESSMYKGGTDSFETKEEDGCYSYVPMSFGEDSKGNLKAEEWVRYKQEESQEYPEFSNGYEDKEQYMIAVFDEEKEKELNVKYYDEGTENVGETEALKIKIEYKKEDYKDVTRESVMEDWKCKEEAVTLADGVSEMLDEYVEANNTLNEVAPPVADTIWIDSASYRVLKRERQELSSDEVIELRKKMRSFENIAGHVSGLQTSLDEGTAKAEALKMYEDGIERAKKEGYYGTDKVLAEVNFTEQYLYDDQCPKLKKLPKDYKEVTQEQYINGDI